MNVAKLRAGYTHTIDEALMIATTPADSLVSPDAKPSIKATSMTGSIVRLDWVNGKFDGVFIDSQLNEESVSTRLVQYAFAI